MPASAAPFVVAGPPAIRGEAAGEGPPIVLCHGITATRRYVLHGSRALERAGHRVVTYDARGHGESDPAPPGRVMDTRGWSPTSSGWSRPRWGRDASCSPATRWAPTPPSPTRCATPTASTGLVVIGPVYTGEIAPDSLRYWDGLAAPLAAGGVDGFVDYIDRSQGIDPAWRDSVLRFTRERMLLHRHPEALVEALREVPRSRPFGSLDELARLQLPALVVASHDEADPGHPYAVAAAYAEPLPRAQLISEGEGESPLAWQGGRLSRELAAFYTKALSSSL